ncbi:hypothetical protein C1887_25335 [Pseudomonas sp. GW456-R21]|nr:hypothetical protein C1887_25335 [Pseudomonas sp. GW456-R21]
MWRGGLPPLGCAAVPISAARFFQTYRVFRFYGCFAPERGQAPPPQRLRNFQNLQILVLPVNVFRLYKHS